MKNKTVNKKVLRAMSIGLAAMMTVQPILATPVFADDTEPVDDAGSSVEATTESSSAETTTESSSAETTTESTSAPAPTVENVTQSYTEASNATADIKTSLDQAVSAGRDSNEFAGFDQNNGGELTNLNKAVVGTEIGTVDANTLNANRTDVSDAAIKLVEDAKRDDKKFEVDADELLELNGQVNKDINKIETAEKDLNDAINKQDEAINKIEITNDFTGTAGLINLETGYYIETATSIPSATEHLENATEYKKDADEKFEQSKADYDKAAADYEAAKDDLKAKQQAYNEALNAAVADDSALIEAKKELETAQEDCKNLENKISEAQNALSNSAISKLAAAVEAGSNWGNLDVIMQDVIKYYYLPGQKVDGKTVSPSDITVERVGDSANERNNYFKATVFGKDFYYNYICEENGKNSAYLSKMVIFEKNPEVIGNHYEDTDDKTRHETTDVENAKEVKIDVIKENTGSDIIKYVAIDGTYYYVDLQNVTVSPVTDQNVTENGADGVKGYKTKVDVTGTTVDYSNGKLTVNTKGDVTTTTFTTGNTLEDIAKTETDAGNYKKALDKANVAIGEAVNSKLSEVNKDLDDASKHSLQKDAAGNNIISADTTISADVTAQAMVDYKTKFTTTINLGQLEATYDASSWDFDLGKGKEPATIKNVVSSLLESIKSSLEEEYGKVTYTTSYDIVHDSKYSGVAGWFEELFRDNHYLGTGTVTFQYYSKNATTSYSGYEKETQEKLSGDANTETAYQNAKAAVINKVNRNNEDEASKVDTSIITNTINGYSQSNGPKFTLKSGSITTVSEAVDKNGDALTVDDATLTDKTKVVYSYSVSKIKYADQYDTVAKDQDIFEKVCDVSELKKVDEYAAIPLKNDNYYNYKKDKDNKDGILADLGDENSKIYQKLMTDVNNFKKLAEKYADAKTKAEDAKEKVAAAQDRVDKLIESINALRANSDSEYKNKLDELESKLIAAKSKLDEAEAEKAKVDAAYKDALVAYEKAVARLTPAPATGDEETAPTAGGGTTTAPAPTVVTTLAGTPVFALPAGGVAAPTAGVAGARTSRGAAIDADSAAADTEDTTAKIAPTKEVEEDALAITKDTIKTIKDNETPLSSLTEDSTQKMNWWWLLLIALLGATGEEIYRRNKKKKEEEAALKAEIDKE